MKRKELFKLIHQFSEHSFPATSGRHIYLWHGDLDELRREISPFNLIFLDLHELTSSLSRTPNSREEASRLFRQSIQNYLYKYSLSNQQQIFVIAGCDLLSHYKIPLTVFYRMSSDSIMFLFVVSPSDSNFVPAKSLPNYVVLNTDETLVYLKEILDPNALIDTSEG